MWTRAQLKDKAKFALKHNYWKAVLVSFLLTALIGGASYTASYDVGEEMGYELFSEEEQSDFDDSEYYDEYDEYDEEDSDTDDLFNLEDESPAYVAGFLIGFITIFVIIFVIAFAVALLWATFITNPVQMGCNRFFFMSLNQKAGVREVAFAFDTNYKNVIKILFFKNLYTALWTLLFWIPGIVKSYEYRMIPYLLAENPNLTKEQAFEISKQMMTGNKWKAFVLDLSFLGWDLLSIGTMGILETFYVGPYKHFTNAAFYEALSLINGRPAFAVQQPNMGTPMQQGQPNPPVQPNPQVQPMQMNPFAQPVPPTETKE